MDIAEAIQHFLVKMGEASGNTRYDDDTILLYLNKGRRKVARDTKFYVVREYLTVSSDGQTEFPLKSSFIDVLAGNEQVTRNNLPLVRKTISDKASIEQLDLRTFPYYVYSGLEENGYWFKIGQILYLHPAPKTGDEIQVFGYAYPPKLTTTTGIDSAFTEEFEDMAILAAAIEAKADARKDFSYDNALYNDRIKKLEIDRDSGGPRYESLPIR